MTDPTTTDLCPPQMMEDLILLLSSGEGLPRVDAVLAAYPNDPRLHFLRGSVLAEDRRYLEGRAAIRHAIELAPDFAVARFQLGFLEFTSGEAELAAQTWAPLAALPASNAFRLFSEGLMRLPADDVEGAVIRLREGIHANAENSVLNRDILMLIEKLGELPTGPQSGASATEEEPLSETQMLLRQFGSGTSH